ncbi:hypothetical protein SAMN05880570_4498 [Paenibacillus sp. RU4T]|nr:hypothetical protein SAMN05880555_4496 [Paenibacillus sp. RU4X]SIR71528.1 hypothetical protein SAMN05880570_4498 [Paenibacillus sp. RU4T]
MRLSSFSRSSADGGRGKRQRMLQGGLLAAVLVLAVHATQQDTVYEAVNFQLEMKMKTPVYFDEKGEAEEYFKLKSIPTTILVDQDGRKHFIYGPLEKTEVEGLLEAYLSR